MNINIERRDIASRSKSISSSSESSMQSKIMLKNGGFVVRDENNMYDTFILGGSGHAGLIKNMKESQKREENAAA